MHISDAVIAPAPGILFAALSLGSIAYSSKKFSLQDDYIEKLPLAGVLAAFVFAAQMINFSIPGTGSSGHLGGGLLLALLLGPHGGLLAISSVLVVQCLFFADGGLLALGMNIFNLGVIPCYLGPVVFRKLGELQSRIPERFSFSGRTNRNTVRLVLSSIFCLELGALGVSMQLLISGRSDVPFLYLTGLMCLIHLPIALVEGLVTAATIEGLAKRCDIVVSSSPRSISSRPILSSGIYLLVLLTLVTGGLGAWFASSDPDGLEWTLEKSNYPQATSVPLISKTLASIQEATSILPDYSLPTKAESNGEQQESWPAIEAGTSLSGLLGAMLSALLILSAGGLARGFSKSRRQL